MKLSVIIVTYNSGKDIYDCLHSLYEYNDLPQEELEVIVVDNQSLNYETMCDRLQTDYPAVRVVQNTRNGGYGQGNNVGIRLATAPIVAIMNPDVRLLQPTLAALVQCFDAPNVVMSGCKQMLATGRQGWSFACSYAMWEPLRVLLRNVCLPLNHFDDRFMYLSGAFFMLRKTAFEEIGMYDEKLFMYGEEPDIYLRFRKHFDRMQISYLPSITYLHDHSKRPYSQNRQRILIKGDTYVYDKHGISTTSYFYTHIFLSYIFQLRAFLKHNKQEAKECALSRIVFKEEMQRRSTMNTK
ncbi:MAG: glycosyltransferase family 2 protein [Paludibacteraceae bacterium]